MAEMFFSLLSIIYDFLYKNSKPVSLSKTAGKYTKSFCFDKPYYQNIFICFCYLCANKKITHYIMYNKNIKLVIAVLVFGLAIWQMIEGYVGNGIMLILLSAIFVFLYFKNELILLAFLKLRKQDFAGAKKWLDKIKNPEAALTTKQQGYHNYLMGIMLSQTNITQAEKYLKKAVKLGLSMNQDLAVAKLNLAGIALTKRRKREAQTLLTEAKKLDKHGMLKDQITMMKQQMKKV